MLRGIKCSQGYPAARRLPVTDSIYGHNSPCLGSYDYCLHVSFFWISMLCRVYNPEPGFFLTYPPPDSHLFSWCHHHVFKFRSRIPEMICSAWVALFNLVWGSAPLCAGLLFLLQSGQLLTRMHLTDWLRQILLAAAITGNFSSHSFCISAPTLAAHNGVPDNLI